MPSHSFQKTLKFNQGHKPLIINNCKNKHDHILKISVAILKMSATINLYLHHLKHCFKHFEKNEEPIDNFCFHLYYSLVFKR